VKELTRKAEFLSVDLVVRSRLSLAPLLETWPWAQTPGRKGTQAPRWIIVTPQCLSKTADKALSEFAKLVEKLPQPARHCWDDASTRTFDIGIQAGLEPSSFEDVQLHEDTLQAIVRIRGRILVTLYAPCREKG
jgi:ligand-binding SRPBCC domain-containing protein